MSSDPPGQAPVSRNHGPHDSLEAARQLARAFELATGRARDKGIPARVILSAADAFSPRVTGMLLPGMGPAGARGGIAINAQRGLTLVQAPEQATFPAMAMSALREDDIDVALPVERLAEVLVQLACGVEVQPNGHA